MSHLLHIHGCRVIAAEGLRAAIVIMDSDIVAAFFTDPRVKKGDALERAIAHARALKLEPGLVEVLEANEGKPIQWSYEVISSLEPAEESPEPPARPAKKKTTKHKETK